MSSTMRPSPTVIKVLSKVKRNPYVQLLCEGLRQDALDLDPDVVDHFSLGWMWRHRRSVHVLHIHWMELFFVYPSWSLSVKRWLSVMLGLLLARLWGICIIYTAHNIWQHEGKRQYLVRWGDRLILKLAQAVHVHDQRTAQLLAERWGRRDGVYVIPHGNYVTAYPNDCTCAEARKRLALEGASFVYLFVGRVRPYKGIEKLIGAFEAMADDDAVLLIVGEAQEEIHMKRIRALAADDDRVRLLLQFVPGEELQFYFAAADVCVLPYQHVTTSGAGILSFSFQVPIIAPRLGCFTQLVGDKERGILYDPKVEGSLLQALEQARGCNLEAMKLSCTQFARRLDWRDIAQQHAAMYRKRCWDQGCR